MSEYMKVPGALDGFMECLDKWADAKYQRISCIRASADVDERDWSYVTWSRQTSERLDSSSAALMDSLADLIREVIASEQRTAEAP